MGHVDWQGDWIGTAADFPERGAAFFRKRFSLDGDPAGAVLYTAAGGFVEISINGCRIDDHLLEPAFTDYSKTLLYLTRDVTKFLRQGTNTLEILLANGWYNPCSEDPWGFHQAHWRGRPRLLCQLETVNDAGQKHITISDKSWEYSLSPVIESDMRTGETYDARVVKAPQWYQVVLMPAPAGKLKPQQLPPVRTVESWKAKRIDRGEMSGCRIYDTGRNISGFLRIKVCGKPGSRVRISYFERLDASGRGDNSRINEFAVPGRAFQEDNYILCGDGGAEVWQPHFVYHGFRYAEIHFPEGTEILDVTVCWNHTDFARRGMFISSDPMINSIQEMCLNSFRSNFQGLPIDCPHREKNGWTGDAKISVHCGLLNFDMETSYRKWLEDCRDAMRKSGELPGIVPSPGWGFAWGNGPCWDIAYPYLAWQLYVYSGNIRILEEHYPSLRRYGEFLHAAKLNTRGLVDWGLADWVPPYGTPMEYTAPREFFTSAYAMLCWSTVSKIAAALELQSDRERFAGYAENCRKAIRLHYYSPETGEYASGSQSAQSVALHLGIPEESEREKVLQGLAALVARDGGGMNCGILGTEAILHALSDGGGRYHELAWSLAVRREYPSWGYMMEHGATTLWESWQGNSSLNHVLFSDISHWFYRVLAGIRPVEKFPGFKYYLLQPQVAGDLRFVKCKVQTPSGTVKVHWRRNGGDFYLTLIQPEGCTACVILPDGSRHELKTPQGKWHCRIPCEQQHVTVTGVETVLI